MHTSSLRSFVSLGFVISALAGCGGEGASSTAASSTAAGSAKPAGSAAAAKTAEAKPADKPAEMKEHDLSTADPKWAGWVAMAPVDAKVMQDGVAGARLAAKGPNLLERTEGGDNGFDVAFGWGKDDLKELKKNLEKGAESSPADFKMKNTWTKEDADLLEWTSEVGKSKSYSFVKHMKVDGKDITCKNNYMMGHGNEAEHKRAMDACATLKKK